MTLQEKYYKLTGSTVNIEKIINNLPESEKLKFLNKLNWQLKSGIVTSSDNQDSMAKLDTIIDISKKLNIGEDIDNDGEVTELEKKMTNIISNAVTKKDEIIESKKEENPNLCFSEEDLINAINNSLNITLGSDITLSKNLDLTTGSIELDFNGFYIYAPKNSEDKEIDAIWVRGDASLTIKGNGGIISSYVAVYVAGDAKVIINSGKFEGSSEAVYCAKNAIVTINGGTFKANLDDAEDPHKFTLNMKDTANSQIIVNGGKFYKFNPEHCLSEGHNTNYLSNSSKVVYQNNFYEVVKK